MNAQSKIASIERHHEMRFIVVDVPEWVRGDRLANIAAAETERRCKRVRDALRANELGTARAHDMVRLWRAIYFWMSGDAEARDEYDIIVKKGGHQMMVDELTRACDVAMKKLEQSWFDKQARPKLESRARALHQLKSRAIAMVADGKLTDQIDACAGLRGEV